MRNFLQRGWLVSGVWLSFLIIVSVFVAQVSSLIQNGGPAISADYLFSSPEDSGRTGGIGPILVSTCLVLLVSIVVAVPFSLFSAVFLSEVVSKNRIGHLIKLCLNMLAGVPSIVFGLFGNAFFCVLLGMGFSILAGGLTLACMILPLMIHSVIEAIHPVSKNQKLNAYALGIGLSSQVFRVYLPAVLPALGVSLILGISRALSETAALIFTSGYVSRMPDNLFDSGRTLSVHILDLALNVPGGTERGFAAALILILLLVFINSGVVFLSGLGRRSGRAR